jgi:hypothetical protein
METSEMPRALRRVCSWCGAILAEGDPGAETSHSICESCYAREAAALPDPCEREGPPEHCEEMPW